MSGSKQVDSKRRSFFVRGSLAAGAGLASVSALASPLVLDQAIPLQKHVAQLQKTLGSLEDREAIRQLQVACTSLLEDRAFDALTALFTDDAQVSLEGSLYEGKQVRQLFWESWNQQESGHLYTGFRQDSRQQQDSIEIDAGLSSASARFHYQVQVSVPHAEQDTLGEMARLQGQYASSRWVHGRLDMAYRKEAGTWKVSRLAFVA